MDARHLATILQKACRDGNMFDGPHSKRPVIDIGFSPDGLHLSTWWNDLYIFKVISWEAVILSHGDRIKAVINDIRSIATDGEWKDVESNTDTDTVV